jgi:methylmalonyl-CoA/ethylmalonyl-CoA epimerase
MSGPLATLGLDHIVVVVNDIEASVTQYARLFGAPSLRESGETVGYYRAVFEVGGDALRVELCQPLAENEPGGDSQASRAFRHRLGRSGEGVHNIAVRVADIEHARDTLTSGNLPLIESAHSGTFFVHPQATSGTLIQLIPEAMKGLGGSASV